MTMPKEIYTDGKGEYWLDDAEYGQTKYTLADPAYKAIADMAEALDNMDYRAGSNALVKHADIIKTARGD